MLNRTDQLYEGLLADVFQVKKGKVIITGELSEDAKEGIGCMLNAMSLSEKEEDILQLRYNCNMTAVEIGELTGMSARKVHAMLENIFQRIKASPSFIHFFRGAEEGDAAALYAKGLLEKQLSEKNGYEDYSKEVGSLDVRYLTQIGISEELICRMYRAGYNEIEDLAASCNKDSGLLIKGLTKKELKEIEEKVKELVMA